MWQGVNLVPPPPHQRAHRTLGGPSQELTNETLELTGHLGGGPQELTGHLGAGAMEHTGHLGGPPRAHKTLELTGHLGPQRDDKTHQGPPPRSPRDIDGVANTHGVVHTHT